MSTTASPRLQPGQNPAPPTPASGFAAVPDWVRWTVVCLLSFGMVIAYTDRVNLSAVLTEIGRDMGLDKERQGMAMSAFFWTYTIFQIPAGMLVDRFGVRVLYLCGFLLWSVASAATTLIGGSFAILIALRLMVGTGESVVTSSSLRYIRDHFDENRRGLAVGIYMSGTKIGPAVGIPIAAYLAKNFGWQSMFLILGAGSLLWLVPFLLLVKKGDKSARGRETAAGSGTASSVTLGQALRTPAMWGIILGTYCYMYFVYYSMTWMPTYFRERHGMSIEKMSWFSFVSFGGMAVVAVLAGWAADKWIARGGDPVRVRKIFTIAGLLAASLQTLSVFTDSQPLMIFFTVASLCGLGLATANYWALTTSLMPGALPVAIQNTAANLAGVVAPWLTGSLIKQTGSFDAPIKAVGVWLALGIGAYVLLVSRKYSVARGHLLPGALLILGSRLLTFPGNHVSGDKATSGLFVLFVLLGAAAFCGGFLSLLGLARRVRTVLALIAAAGALVLTVGSRGSITTLPNLCALTLCAIALHRLVRAGPDLTPAHAANKA